MIRSRSAPGLAAGSLLLLPLPASAHLVSTGLGPVYDGISHLALTPDQLLPMAALALYAGLRGPAQSRHLLFLLPPVWLFGCWLSPPTPPGFAALASAILLLGAGALLAADPKIPRWLADGIAIAFGLVLGLLYGVPAGTAPGPEALAALGAAATIFILIALLASLSLPLRALAPTIAVRVAGSWTSALGLLLIGWWVHGVR